MRKQAFRSDARRTRADHEADFLAKVKTDENGCWIWQGARFPNGYGVMSYFGKARPAHRVSWELANDREFPAGMYACHSCDNKLCVNPDHIVAGTPAGNVKQAWKARRAGKPSGDPSPALTKHERWEKFGDRRRKLTEAQVREMKRIRDEEGISYQKIADRFGVTEGAARMAIQGKRWGHLV